MSALYLRRWNVTGSTGTPYVVSLTRDKLYACSCPAWKFHRAPRPECKHIAAIRATLRAGRFAGLEVTAAAPAQLPELGARFRHLDLDIEVTA